MMDKFKIEITFDQDNWLFQWTSGEYEIRVYDKTDLERTCCFFTFFLEENSNIVNFDIDYVMQAIKKWKLEREEFYK